MSYPHKKFLKQSAKAIEIHKGDIPLNQLLLSYEQLVALQEFQEVFPESIL